MDRRVYNGCLSDDLQREMNRYNILLDGIKTIEPDAICTYFPMEGKYQVHAWGKPISGFFVSRINALQDALYNLENN